MKQRYIILSLCALCVAVLYGQSVKQVEIGQQMSLAQALGNDWNTADSLVITGHANDQDLEMLRQCIYQGVTSGVDMSGCSVAGDAIPDMAFAAEFQTDEHGITQPSSQLRYFTLPATLRRIGDYAFAFTGLCGLVLPESIEAIGNKAFWQCLDLSGDIVVPEGCQVGDNAMEWALGVTRVQLQPGSVLGRYAMSTMPALRSAELQAGCETGAYALTQNQSLDEVAMADDVKLGDGTFALCPGLTEVCLPAALPRIGYDLFYRTGLATFSWPDIQSVEGGNYAIGDRAFMGCQLTDVAVPEGVTQIGAGAFAGNQGLERIVLPGSLSALSQDGVLDNCPSLIAIYSKATIPAVFRVDDAFAQDLCQRATLYVPAGAKQYYQAMMSWRNFQNIVEVDAFPYSGVDGITAPTTDDDVYYDLRGIRVKKPSCGLYIHRGKVVAVP